jgi:hypothetical protein
MRYSRDPISAPLHGNVETLLGKRIGRKTFFFMKTGLLFFPRGAILI